MQAIPERGPKPPPGLEQPTLTQRYSVIVDSDDVIQRGHVDQCQRFLESQGHHPVGGAIDHRQTLHDRLGKTQVESVQHKGLTVNERDHLKAPESGLHA